VIALWGGSGACLRGSGAFFVVHELREAFGDRLYGLLARHRRAEEVRQEARLRRRAKRYRLPVVAATEVLYHKQGRRRCRMCSPASGTG